jgi:hypothetical protein
MEALKLKDDGSGQFETDVSGLVNSFLLSVGNDTLWKPVLEISLGRCNDQFKDYAEEFYCSGSEVQVEVDKTMNQMLSISELPKDFLPTAFCSYLENFIKCPRYNPDPACKITMKYVQKCMRDQFALKGHYEYVITDDATAGRN